MSCEWLLIDGPSLIFRAYYGALASAHASRTDANAVAGFLDRLARLVADRRPRRLVVAEDWAWRPQWRVELIADYKAHRVAELVPPDFAILRGDPSDGLPGLRGVGAVTAAAMIRRHGDIAGVLRDRPLRPADREYLQAAITVVRPVPAIRSRAGRQATRSRRVFAGRLPATRAVRPRRRPRQRPSGASGG
jgi:5'-3' exonuclease